MTLQSPGDLGLSALGVDGDLQPRSTLPSLVDGIHLRWGSGLDRGFPEYGYYLYRREHIGAQVTPHSLTDGLSESASLAVGETITAGDWSVTVEAATAASRRDEFTLAADGSISAGGDGVDELAISMQQSGRVSGSGNAGGSGRWSGFEPIVPRFPDPGSLKLSLPEPAFRVELTVAPEYPGDTPGQPTLPGGGMNATALAEDVTLDRATGLSRGTVTLRSDAITAIDITGSGSVLDVEIYPVSAQIDQNWQPVPKASAPITLPVTHPNYPAASGSEDLNAARTTIDDRIQYRDPDRYAGAWPSSQPSGTVTTTDGSPIVHGSGTGWTAADAGKVFRVAGDDSAYVVLTVLDSDRLVLSRPHDGATTGLNYDLVADDFGRLYDAMIDCVAGSDSQVGMAGRAVPQPVFDPGVSVTVPVS
jgi:hypothetical protein